MNHKEQYSTDIKENFQNIYEKKCQGLLKILNNIGEVKLHTPNFKEIINYAENPEKSKFNYFTIELTTKKPIAKDLIQFINNQIDNGAYLNKIELNELSNNKYVHYVDIVIKEIEKRIKTNDFPKQSYHFQSLIENCEKITIDFLNKLPKLIKDYRQKICDRNEKENWN